MIAQVSDAICLGSGLVVHYIEKENSEKAKQFIAENEKETLAQVFTDVRYTKANNEHFSKVLIEVLKKQGFWQ